MLTLLEAAPGAGKTTRVPPALLRAGFEQVLVLEPRRLAARLAANRVAEEFRERLGATVGFQIRFERVGGKRTRLWYLTEGVLTNRLLSGQPLPQGTVIVLDEFHERHLETDLALALLRRIQESRPDLRVLLMSATLGSELLSEKVGSVPVIRSEGKTFGVDIRYTPSSSAPLEEQIATAVEIALKQTTGHVLVFLPGSAEIRNALRTCEPLARRVDARVLALHGSLSAEEQDLAVAPSDFRKIICSTNVAESSITIEGVEAVIDSGLARIVSHSHWSGLSRLELSKISKSSAVQRAGRAARTGPGIAIRLYPESDFVRRPNEHPPEILRVDPSEMLLQLAASGWSLNDLRWLDKPSEPVVNVATELLKRLGAFEPRGQISAFGQRMSALPLHPRLACFVLHASTDEALAIAAVLSEGRTRFTGEDRPNLSSDLDLLLQTELPFTALRVEAQLREAITGRRTKSDDPHVLEKAFLRAYPDRVARKRGEVLLLSNGGSARLDRQSLTHSEFLVAVEVDDRSAQGARLVRIAIPIEPDWLLDLFPDRIETREELCWNRESERVENVNSLEYESLVIDESRSAPLDIDTATEMLVRRAKEAGIERFVDAEELGRFVHRVRFAAEHASSLEVPANLLGAGLRRLATGLVSFGELRGAAKDGGLIAALESMLDMRVVNEIAPAFIKLPSGRRARVEYQEGQTPSVSSRLQDFFGMKETPAIANGSVALVVKLLGPNQRPVQVTTDLVSFWKNLYPQLRRELGRRYPKHAWPEVPV